MLSALFCMARQRVVTSASTSTRHLSTTSALCGKAQNPPPIKMASLLGFDEPVVGGGLDSLATLLEEVDGGKDKVASRQAATSAVYESFRINSHYQPFDLMKQHREIKKGRRRAPPNFGPSAPVSKAGDVFRQLHIDPVDEACNPMLLQSYTSSMGKILGRNRTNLSWKSQRKIGKAIRRARNMGTLPILSNPRLSAFGTRQRSADGGA